MQFFCYFFDKDIVQMIVAETNRHAVVTNVNTNFSIVDADVYKYIGILMYMSVYKYPNLDAYWSDNAFAPIADTMAVKRFMAIKKHLSFANQAERKKKGEPGSMHDSTRFQKQLVFAWTSKCVPRKCAITCGNICQINRINGGSNFLCCVIRPVTRISSKCTMVPATTCCSPDARIWEPPQMLSFVYPKQSWTSSIISYTLSTSIRRYRYT